MDLTPSLMSVTSITELEASIFVPFTRLRYLDEFLAKFLNLDIDWSKVEVVFYNDTDNMEIQNKLREFLLSHKFGGYRLQMSHQTPLDESGDQNHANRRRERIIRMRYKAQELIRDTKYLFCLEDDTMVPRNAYKKLRKLLDKNSQVGVASGVEAGRWAYKHIGAWEIQPVDDPQTVRSLPYQEKGISEADGTGMYCYLTYTSLYKEASFRNEAEPLGPDVLYGLDLRRKGYKVLVDWSIVCEHKGMYGDLWPKDANELIWFRKHNNGTWVLERWGDRIIKY